MTETPLPKEIADAVVFDADGLVPAIAQQHDTGETLMMAWMNRAALAETLATGRVCYWSRSRRALWRKGERSGQVQRLVELRVDCDGDTLLLRVEQTGVACHTGRRSCFYRALTEAGSLEEILPVEVDPAALYGEPGADETGGDETGGNETGGDAPVPSRDCTSSWGPRSAWGLARARWHPLPTDMASPARSNRHRTQSRMPLKFRCRCRPNMGWRPSFSVPPNEVSSLA